MMNGALYVRHWGSTTDGAEAVSSDTVEPSAGAVSIGFEETPPVLNDRRANG